MMKKRHCEEQPRVAIALAVAQAACGSKSRITGFNSKDSFADFKAT